MGEDRLTPAERRTVRRAARGITFLGAAATFAGARLFLEPGSIDATAVGHALRGPWDEAWSLLYIVGGAMVIYGTQRPSPRVELPGLTLVLAALIVNVVAVFATRGVVGLGQLPLYALALWVVAGRYSDLRGLSQERRRGWPDGRPTELRVERRRNLDRDVAAIITAPALMFGSVNLDLNTLLVTIMGGGLLAALMQGLLYRPQKRDLLAKATDAATSAAERMLNQQRKELDSAQEDLNAAQERIRELEGANDQLRREVDAAREEARSLRARLQELGAEVARMRQTRPRPAT